MKLINRLPHQWQQPAREIVRYALAIKPSDYVINAFVAPTLGVVLIGFVFLNAALLLKLLAAFSVLNLFMAGFVSVQKGARK